jgi:hypothetical protein
MDQSWHSIFDNSMRQPWLYFCYRFDVPFMNSLTLSITYVGSKSLFIHDFKVYSDCVFAANYWISSDSVFDNSMRRPSFYFCYWFYTSVMNSLTLSIPCDSCHSVFINNFKVYSYSVFIGDLRINRDMAFLTIPCVDHDSIFAIDFMRRWWIQWCCRFHTAVVTQYLMKISMSTVTLLSLVIYGSAVT